MTTILFCIIQVDKGSPGAIPALWQSSGTASRDEDDSQVEQVWQDDHRADTKSAGHNDRETQGVLVREGLVQINSVSLSRLII